MMTGYAQARGMAWGSYYQRQQSSFAQQCALQQLNNLYQQTGLYNDLPGIGAKPCPYCKRTAQTKGHTSCDGCGAPR